MYVERLGGQDVSDSESAVVSVLKPHMGTAIASAFVTMTAISLHKDAADLGPEDFSAIEGGLRSVLANVASPQIIDKALGDVRMALEQGR